MLLNTEGIQNCERKQKSYFYLKHISIANTEEHLFLKHSFLWDTASVVCDKIPQFWNALNNIILEMCGQFISLPFDEYLSVALRIFLYNFVKF